MPTSPHNQANQDAGQGGGSSSSDVENNPEENWTGKSASCNVGGSDKCVVVTGVHQQKPHNDSNDGGLRGGKESILGGCPGQEKAATMNCLTGQAPSNDSQGSINPEGGEKCECQTDGGNDGFVWTNPTYLYNFQEEMCFIHSSPLNADITMVSGRQGSVGTSVPGTLGLRPEPLLEETKNASSLFLGQIQRPQKVPHSKPLVQATHLVSKCRRRKKGGTTPEICQDPWLGNYRVELMKSLHINVDLGFGNCNESFYGSSCQ
ncbi:hypothetical protein GBAR_LOCUS15992 [Geodia barretti]|nr:hypothetical protein GBAR_LOCUS15992 [Geodia barretti]